MKHLVNTLSTLNKKLNNVKPNLQLSVAPVTESQQAIFDIFNSRLDHIVEPVKLSSLKSTLLKDINVQGRFIGNLNHEKLITGGLTRALSIGSIFRKTNSMHIRFPGCSEHIEYDLSGDTVHYLSPSPNGAVVVNRPIVIGENFNLPTLPLAISLPGDGIENPGDLGYLGQTAGFILATYENFAFTKLLKETANLTEQRGNHIADVYSAIKRGRFKEDILIILPNSFLEDSENLIKELNHPGKVVTIFVPDNTLKGLNLTSVVLERSGDFNICGFQQGNHHASFLELTEEDIIIQTQSLIGYSMSGKVNATIINYNYNLKEMNYEFL